MTIDVNSLELLETTKLHEELRRLLVLTADTIGDCAVVYAELTSRGEACPYLPKSIAQALTLVADHVLTPEAALAFGNSAVKTRLVAGLEEWNQRKLSSGQLINVAVRHGDRFRQVLLPGPAMSVKYLEQTIVDGRLLTYEEQIARARKTPVEEPEEALRRVCLLFPADLLKEIQRIADSRKVLVIDLVVQLLREVLHMRKGKK